MSGYYRPKPILDMNRDEIWSAFVGTQAPAEFMGGAGTDEVEAVVYEYVDPSRYPFSAMTCRDWAWIEARMCEYIHAAQVQVKGLA